MKIHSIHKILFIGLLLLLSLNKIKAQTADTTFINKTIDSVYIRQHDSAFAFSRIYNAINWSYKINYMDGVVSGMQLKALLFFQFGIVDSARFNFLESHKLTSSITNQSVIAQNYRLLSIYYEGTENIEKALDLLFKSLLIRKRLGDLKGEAGCYVSIGICFQRLGQYRKAVYYYKKALNYFEQTNIQASISAIYSNLGTVYNSLGKIDSAIFFLKRVILIKKKVNDVFGLSKAYHNIGTAYFHKGEYNVAIGYYNKSITLTGGGENNFNNANDFAMLGLVHYKQGNYDESEKELLLAEKLFRKIQNSGYLSEVLENLTELYDAKKDFDKSILYRTYLSQLKDSIDQITNRALIIEYETKYLSVEKERQNELLMAKNSLLESESKHNTLLLFSLMVVIVIGLILAYNLRIVKHSKNKLQHQNEIIAHQNREVATQNLKLASLIEENQTLMGILAHDLRAPFSKIFGLSNLLADEQNEKEKEIFTGYINDICKDALQLIQDTVNISQIYNENSEELKQKMEVFNPIELLENSINSFKAIALEKQITILFNNTIPNIEINNSKEYLSRIFDNLISNSIKFSPSNTSIVLNSSKIADKLVLSIKDEGLGFTEEDKKLLFTKFKKLSARPTGNEASSGLGLFIVKQLADLIGANIRLISEQGKGSEFVVELPLN